MPESKVFGFVAMNEQTSFKVAILELNGDISLDNENCLTLMAFLREESPCDAIMLVVNSGGGSFAAAQELALALARAPVPVYCFAKEICASAALLVCMEAKCIVALPASLIGGMRASLIGLRPEATQTQTILYSRGALKAMLSTQHAVEDKALERQAIDDLLRDLDAQFHSQVRRRRPEAKIDAMTDGRLVSGARACDLGLIDAMGDFHSLLECIAERHDVSVDAIECVPVVGDVEELGVS